jgi:hypothetical protein
MSSTNWPTAYVIQKMAYSRNPWTMQRLIGTGIRGPTGRLPTRVELGVLNMSTLWKLVKGGGLESASLHLCWEGESTFAIIELSICGIYLHVHKVLSCFTCFRTKI